MIKKTFIIWLSVIMLISFSACNSENVTDMSEKTIVVEANSSSYLAAKTVKDSVKEKVQKKVEKINKKYSKNSKSSSSDFDF